MKKILHIDDEKEYTDLLRMNLEQTGRFEVRSENDPTAALAAAEEFRPDLILLDIVMPGMDGGDFSALVKSHPELGKTPIILISALISSEETGDDSGVSQTGGTTIIAKPVKMKTLLRCIDEVFA